MKKEKKIDEKKFIVHESLIKDIGQVKKYTKTNSI